DRIAQVTMEEVEETFRRSAEAEAKAKAAKAARSPRTPAAPAGRATPTREAPPATAPTTIRTGRVAAAPMLDDGMRRVQVLGKIDPRKAEPPARRRPASPGSVVAMPAPAPTETTDEAGRRKKGRKVIRKPGQFDPFGTDRGGRGGRKPLKKRAAPG